ncbi:MAG: hypothetical protein AVDCRST_MAG35-223 [uncultured Quadrisphaera sp.]|uniref:Uncharacterized protein n=1 Tax=uncultured Quadrisphaera sp. TaxID=904978 RepID=A0A6J4NGV0_9ACTN|nr:MAG: hypothetical protein AVDCRST_MAG35-223 [uncultured Quadrisphaera sp.]
MAESVARRPPLHRGAVRPAGRALAAAAAGAPGGAAGDPAQ